MSLKKITFRIFNIQGSKFFLILQFFKIFFKVSIRYFMKIVISHIEYSCLWLLVGLAICMPVLVVVFLCGV